jgi:hypothetical protein
MCIEVGDRMLTTRKFITRKFLALHYTANVKHQRT